MGSGCSPPGDVLPDGIWFGFAEAVEGGVITFDLGCYFSEPAASVAAAHTGNRQAMTKVNVENVLRYWPFIGYYTRPICRRVG